MRIVVAGCRAAFRYGSATFGRPADPDLAVDARLSHIATGPLDSSTHHDSQPPGTNPSARSTTHVAASAASVAMGATATTSAAPGRGARRASDVHTLVVISIGQVLGQSSSGRWLPRRLLHRRWASRKLARSVEPPLERGTRWSIVGCHGPMARGSIASPHSQHHQPSRSAIRVSCMVHTRASEPRASCRSITGASRAMS